MAQGSLTIGQNSSNFGTHALTGGFVPDPKQITGIVSGGSLNAANMNLGAGCTGYLTQQPDVIVNYSSPASFLRFYFQGSGDTTLVINDARGRWRCNDDTAGLNPQVDIASPPPGHYDIWVGSYEAGANIRGTLKITELRSNSVSP
ncbi:MAG: peptidase S1 [Myxococcota bacterium]